MASFLGYTIRPRQRAPDSNPIESFRGFARLMRFLAGKMREKR
jgi:hypothetical protein